jgi:hypothetical protein
VFVELVEFAVNPPSRGEVSGNAWRQLCRNAGRLRGNR